MTNKKNTNNPKTRNRYFGSGLSLMYNGNLYPASETSILNEDGTTTTRNIGVDANNNYFYVENGQPRMVESLYNLPEVTVTSKMPTSVKAANQQKQAYMRAAGYDVPKDGSWNEEQQSIWDNLTTKPKEYDPTLTGIIGGYRDKLLGNTTERVDPLYQGEVKAYNPDEVDWEKTRKSQNKVVNALTGTYGPLVALASTPYLGLALKTAPIATIASLSGGAAGGYAVNKASEALTGRDFGTNVAMHTPLTPGMGEMLNPGYVAGGYGAERRMLDAIYNQVTPYSYTNSSGLVGSIPKTKELGLAVRDFLMPKRIRTSVNDTPAWKQRIDFNAMGKEAEWVNLYRDDAWRLAMKQKPRTIDINGKPHSLYIKNPDGTYRYDLEYINQRRLDAGIAPLKYTDFPVFTNKNKLHEGLNNVVAGDAFTGNGGFVNVNMELPKDWDIPTPSNWDYSIIETQHPLRVRDKWDIQPLIDSNRSIAPAFSRWLTRHPNRITNYIKNKDVVEALGGNPFMLDMQVEPNMFRDIIVGK